jgi:pimeloyl-ACP methyl ester carboxylesterase
MSITPTFLLIPGAWHLPAYLDPVISYLSNHSYPSVAVTLPAVNSYPAVTSIQSDVTVAADALTALLNNGSDVIVVMHSYGGMVGTDAVGKVVAERAGHGNGGGSSPCKRKVKKKSGKIRRLVYVAAHIPLEGQTLFEAIDWAVQEPPPPPTHIEVEVGSCTHLPLFGQAIT